MPSFATLEQWRRAMAAAPRVPRATGLSCSAKRAGAAAGQGAAVDARVPPPTTTPTPPAPGAADLPAGYIRRPPARGRRGRGATTAPEAPTAPAAERAAVAAAVALAASASSTDDEDEDDDNQQQLELAPQQQQQLQHTRRQPRKPPIPPHFLGLARDSGRPWQRAEIRRLLAAGSGDGDDDDNDDPSRSSLYAQMTAPRLKRVLDARVSIESDARRLLEEARWQRERAEGWAAAAALAQEDDGATAPTIPSLPGGPRLLDFTVRTGLAEVANLASECGAAEAQLAQLARAARAYRDSGYGDHRQGHASSVAALLSAVRQFCAHYRERTAPALEVVLGAWAGAELEERESPGRGSARRRQRPPPPLLPAGWLPPPLPRAETAVQWRYPPAEYVVFRRKGAPGQRAREHPLAPAMRARAERAAREASQRAARGALGGGGGGEDGGGGLFD